MEHLGAHFDRWLTAYPGRDHAENKCKTCFKCACPDCIFEQDEWTCKCEFPNFTYMEYCDGDFEDDF